ncbi:MAG: LON peptidase substrate-binding domain-containing protein, partial [Pseudomonadales bacterium]
MDQLNQTDNLTPLELPVLPLRDVVVYPHMVIPLFVGRDKSIEALEAAMAGGKEILLLAQRNASEDEPGVKDLFEIGTVASILQMLKLPDGTVKVLVEGDFRAQVKHIEEGESFFSARVDMLDVAAFEPAEAEVYKRSAIEQFERFVQINKKIPSEVLTSLQNIDEVGRLADTIAAHMSLKLSEKQQVLEMLDDRKRLEHLMSLMEVEIDLVEVEKRIRGRVKKQMEKSQREYYLNEQMKAIQKELGDLDDAPNENEELTNKIHKAGMPKEALDKTLNEMNKLK